MKNDSGGRLRGYRVLTRSAVGVAILAASALASGAGCKSSSSSGADCVSNRTFFEQSVWSPFMSTKCGKCHTPDGVAVADKGAKLVLEPASYPGFIDTNLATLTELTKVQYEGKSELLQKPLGKMSHGGGTVLDEGSDEYKALTELVDRLGNTDSCSEPVNRAVSNVTVMDAPSTLRKASLALAARLPTQDETDAVTKGGDASLDAALDVLMKEQPFYDRIREIWNDILLTDRGLNYGGAALGFLDDEMYPNRNYDDKDPNRYLANQAIAREPLDLIAYVVKNDRPFTEILKADYAIVNPFSAQVYGVKDVTFKDPTDYEEFHETHITAANGVVIPHAGLLSTPSFLNRWQTTQTNRNRGRARRVFQFFLATDVLKIAERPVDATLVTAEENPTVNSAYCNVCHRVIDPVAGGFRGWDDQDYESFDPMGKWHDDMFQPGFGAEKMDPAFYNKAVVWLGSEVSNDPRFALSAVYTVYKGLTGHDPIQYPNDATVADFDQRLSAWEAQDAFFRKAASDFTGGKFNLKVIFKAVIKSPYYRAIAGNPAQGNSGLQDLGTGRLLTPEMLNRKIIAVTGLHWRSHYDWDNEHDRLVEEYPILYGGIDSDSVTSRLPAANGVVSSVAARMANEMSCWATAYDFTKAKADRRFFPAVDLAEVPESSGHAVDGSVTDIRKNIQHLHELLLGEKLDDNDPEIDRTYQLFLDTWHELSQSGDTDLTYECSGRWDQTNGKDLPDEVQIKDDKNFTVRSWMAVMTYMLSDYKFLYE